MPPYSININVSFYATITATIIIVIFHKDGCVQNRNNSVLWGAFSINCTTTAPCAAAPVANWLKLVSVNFSKTSVQRRSISCFGEAKKTFSTRRFSHQRDKILSRRYFCLEALRMIALPPARPHAPQGEMIFKFFICRRRCVAANQKGTAKRMGPRGPWSVFLTASLLIRHAELFYCSGRKLGVCGGAGSRARKIYAPLYTTGCISSALRLLAAHYMHLCLKTIFLSLSLSAPLSAARQHAN